MSKQQLVRGAVALDFDGVLSEGAGYHWPLTGLDLTLIRQAQARGYAVAVMTCNTAELVADELQRHGIVAVADVKMEHARWDHPRFVLVTNRKIAADLYVDDKAVRYRYGEPASVVLDALDAREGYHPCPSGRHWGPYGAAGVLPFTVFRGRLYVLMGLRSKHVQQPGTWSGFGGALEDFEEDTWAAARRELGEEVSGLDGSLCEWADYCRHECEACGWFYVTFLAEVPASDPGDGAPRLPAVRVASDAYNAWETDEVCWVRVEDVAGYALHPGFAEAWPWVKRSLESYCGLMHAA